MKKQLFTSALLLLVSGVCLISGPLLAQEIGPNISQTPNLEDFSITRYGDWEVICEKKTSQTCIMGQVGLDSQGIPVVEMRIRKLDKNRKVEGKEIVAVADILTPLAVMLIPGVELQIDLGPVYAAPYQLCIESGCIVREPLAEETIKAFNAGNKASISMIAAIKQKEVRATISLKGFTKAFRNLK